MANFRQIHVSMWKDEWFLELEPNEKLLFIYFFSNESTSLSGLYKLPLKVLLFETGLEKQFVLDTLSKFSDADKIHYDNGIVWVVNMRRYHETKSQKVQIRIQRDIAMIPNCQLKIGYLYRMDTRLQLKEEEEEKEKEYEDDKTTIEFTQLQTAFVNASGIPAYGNDAETYDILSKAGVSPEDITKAVKTLQSKKYTIKGIGSIVTTAINIAKQRGVSPSKTLEQQLIEAGYTSV